jgi:hypothetical protein
MPRRSSSRGGGFSRSRSSSPMPTRTSMAATRPMPARQAPPLQAQTQQTGSMMGGIGSTIATGMAFGAGS